MARAGKTEAKAFAQGLGRLGFASIALDWERPFLGKVGALTLPAMVRVLCGWRREAGSRSQNRYWKGLRP